MIFIMLLWFVCFFQSSVTLSQVLSSSSSSCQRLYCIWWKFIVPLGKKDFQATIPNVSKMHVNHKYEKYNLNAKCRQVFSLTHQQLYSCENSSRYPLNKVPECPHPVWTWWQREKNFSPAGNWTPVVKLVAQTLVYLKTMFLIVLTANPPNELAISWASFFMRQSLIRCEVCVGQFNRAACLLASEKGFSSNTCFGNAEALIAMPRWKRPEKRETVHYS